jgi:hypothetical protein
MENQVQEQEVIQQVQETAPVAQQEVQSQQESAPQEMQSEQSQEQQKQEQGSSWKITSINSEGSIYDTSEEYYEEEQQEQVQEQVQGKTQAQAEKTQDDGVLKLVPDNYKQDTAETAASSQTEEYDPFEKLGVKDDAYFKKLYEAYKNDALDEFLITTHTDYDAISDADILRMQIDSQYKNLSDDDRDLIFQMKLQKDFNISDLNSDDSRAGKLMMKLAAQEIRDGLKQQQAEYQPPTRPNEVEQFKQKLELQQLEAQKQVEDFKNYFTQTQEYKQFETSRLVEFGDKENKVRFEIDTSADFLGETLDQQKFFSKFVKDDGQVDVAKWQRVWAYANNPQAVERALINSGKSAGEKRLFDELKNTRNDDGYIAPKSNNSFVIKSIDGKPFGY